MIQSPPGRILLYSSIKRKVMIYKDVTEIDTKTSQLMSADEWVLTSVWDLDSIMANKLIPVSAHFGRMVNLSFVSDGTLYELGKVISRQDEIPNKAIYIGRRYDYQTICRVSSVKVGKEMIHLVNTKDASRPVFLVQGVSIATNMQYARVKNVVLPSGIGGATQPNIKTWIVMA